MNEELENQLRDDLMTAYKICREKLKYNPSYFLSMLHEKDAVDTAMHLVNRPVPSDGFTRLWEEGRLDLSVEAHVIKEKYHSLFSQDVIDNARARLNEYNHEC